MAIEWESKRGTDELKFGDGVMRISVAWDVIEGKGYKVSFMGMKLVRTFTDIEEAKMAGIAASKRMLQASLDNLNNFEVDLATNTEITVSFTKEEMESCLISDLNMLLRACGRPYFGYPSLNFSTASAFNKIYKAICGKDHSTFVKVFGEDISK